MADAVVHALLVAVCVLLAVIAHGDVTAVLIVGVLVVVSLAALAVLVRERRWIAMAALYCA
ncbi:hypothetical protein, partial [Bifidobacterium italicum]